MSSYPEWMFEVPKPEPHTRKLSGIDTKGWIGTVRLADIKYWVDNRRTDLQVSRLKGSIGGSPDNDQVFDRLVDDPDLEIERLAKSIIRNGLREPVVLSYDRILLDGNRRYLAHLWIAKNGTVQQRQQFDKLRAWVLAEECSDQRWKLRVVTEYNLLEDLRKNWTDYVKAKLLWEEYNDGYNFTELVELYGGAGFGRHQITELVKTYEIVVEFLNSYPDEDAPIQLAADNFIWFQQLQRSYRDEIRNEEEFQKVIFDNIRRGNITSTEDLKRLKEVKRHPDAWSQFKNGDVTGAHLTRQIYEKIEEDRPNLDGLLIDVNAKLGKLTSQKELLFTLSDELCSRFHELAIQVPGQVGEVEKRADYITRVVQTLTSKEIASFSDEAIRKLALASWALATLLQQAEATRGAKS